MIHKEILSDVREIVVRFVLLVKKQNCELLPATGDYF
jgi:hypothetical protein